MGMKSLAAAQYILNYCKDHNTPVTPMQLIKLVYIAHGWCLGVFGRPLLNEKIEAWAYGPVIPSVYQNIRYYRSQPVENIFEQPDEQQKALELLSNEEKDLLNFVAKVYANVDGITLSNATHQPNTPWAQTYREGYNKDISNDIIEHFYRSNVIDKRHDAL